MFLSEKRFAAIDRKVKSILKHTSKNNPFDIATFYNINCQFVDLPENISAYSNSKDCTIYINKCFKVDNYSAKILCAHELGHIFLHYNDIAAMEYNRYIDSKITDESIKEYEANIFAILLMPQIAKGENLFNYRPERLNRYIHNKLRH